MATRALTKLPEITIGKFTLTDTGMRVQRGRPPSFEEYEAVGEFIKRAHHASGWWLADWLRYGDNREDWKEHLSQAHHATGLTEKRLKNVRAIGAIPESRRRDGVEMELHGAVVALPPEEQNHWLEAAESQGWSLHELRANIRAASRRRVIDGQAVLAGMYRVILADPPWLYGDSGATADGSLGKAARHYDGMTIEELAKLPVAAHALPHSLLAMWTTAPLLLENPGPREVLEAWGFTYKTNLVWDKVLPMPGHYALDNRHEHLIIATRGNGMPDAPTPLEDSVLVERRSTVHSAKPESVRKWLMRHWTVGPYLELFGRDRVDGWDVFGNDAKLWAQEVSA